MRSLFIYTFPFIVAVSLVVTIGSMQGKNRLNSLKMVETDSKITRDVRMLNTIGKMLESLNRELKTTHNMKMRKIIQKEISILEYRFTEVDKNIIDGLVVKVEMVEGSKVASIYSTPDYQIGVPFNKLFFVMESKKVVAVSQNNGIITVEVEKL